VVATVLLTAAAVIVVIHVKAFGGWLLMIFLLAAMGPRIPPRPTTKRLWERRGSSSAG